MKRAFKKIKKNFREFSKKTMALFMSMTMLVNMFLPITTVFAITQEEKNELVELQMRNVTNIVIDGNKATIIYEHGTAEIIANGLKAEKDENHDFGNSVGLLWILYTSDTDISFSFNPDDGYQVQYWKNGQSQSVSNNTYQINDLQLGNSIDVEFVFESINQGGNNPTPPANNNYPDDIQIEATYDSDGLGMNITFNGANVGGESKNIVETAKGYATGTEKNIIKIQLAFGDGNLGSVLINGQEMPLPEDVGDFAEFEVDPASEYIIVVKKSEDRSNVPCTIIWTNPNYIPIDEEDAEWVSDFEIGHGYAKVIEIYDENGKKLSPEEYVGENSDEFGLDNGFGWVKVFPKYKAVFEFVPEYGYQLTEIKLNGQPMEASENINFFTVTIPEGGANIHFGAVFTKTEDIVKSNSEKVVSGDIELGNKLVGGSAQLTVSDAELSSDKISGFENVAGDYTISNYLDIDLYNVFYKGKNDADDVWQNKISELDEYATISIKLEDGVSADDIVIVHNVHDGDEYEIIEIDSYDPATNTITFKTKSFSNYAIATKNNIEITTSDDTIENNSAKEEVTKLIEQIISGKIVNGIQENLQDDIKNALENGKTISVNVRRDSIKENEALEDATKIKTLIGNDSSVLGYYDIAIELSIDGTYKGNVTLLDEAIAITLDLPSGIPDVASGYNRTYTVIRVHDGEAEKLDTTLNSDGTITFKTDKFSTYAITYTDSKIISNPNTGDNVLFYIITLMLSVSGITVSSIILNKRKKICK